MHFKFINISRIVLILTFALYLGGCATSPPESIRFFVMGHVHTWFSSEVAPTMRANQERLDYLILTGDVVENSTTENWEVVNELIQSIEPATYIAPGNHDLNYANKETGESYVTYPLYEHYFGQSYRSFRVKSNLFIFLDTITSSFLDAQKEMIDFELANLDNIKNVFVFTHYLQYVHTQSRFSCLIGHIHMDKNSPDSKHNIWLYTEERLQDSHVKTYYFSGDIGVDDHAGRIQAPAFYDQTDNLTILSSGMGNPLESYYDVIVENGIVDIKQIAFDDSIQLELSDFTLDKYSFCD